MSLDLIDLNMPMNYATAMELSRLVDVKENGFTIGEFMGKVVTITLVMDMLIFRVEGEITNYWLQSLDVSAELEGKSGKLIDLF